MLHVAGNVQNYLMFEVLEGSWSVLVEEIKRATTLDEMIAAHDGYLANILNKGLLGDDDESRALAGQMSLVFDIADQFCKMQERLFVDCLSVLSGDSARRDKVQRRIQEGRWGSDSLNVSEISGGDDDYNDGGVEDFGIKSLEGVERSGAEFETAFRGLLVMLSDKLNAGGEEAAGVMGHDALRFLTFRLDFNEFYRKKWEAEEK